MTKLLPLATAISILTFASSCTMFTEEEETVPLSDVPQVVMDAAVAAVDGIVFTEAEREVEWGKEVWELEGTANGERYEVEVTPEGKVIEIEKEDEDDDDD